MDDEQRRWRAELAARRALPWSPYDGPHHRCVFVGGPHDQVVRQLPSMPGDDDPKQPALWIEVWFHNNYRGLYAREGLRDDPVHGPTWHYSWGPRDGR